MDKVLIRKIERPDLKGVSTVFRNVFKSVGENWSARSSAQHVMENFNKEYCYLAEKDGKIVGIMLANIQTRVKGPELFIDTIAVLPDIQKNGLGQRFLDLAAEIVNDEGLVGLSLLANPSLKSFAWYKKNGIKESGWVELYKLKFP